MDIVIKERFLKAKKTFFQGTHRLCSPEETLEKVMRENERIGLTRIADITGFDHIGIPVTATIRPNSHTLSSSSGKGLTKASAFVSGIMEALELYHAENYKPDIFAATSEELGEKGVSLDQLSRRKNGIFPKNWPYDWCFGWDLITQKELAVPVMAVTLNTEVMLNDPFDLDSFEVSSNGLASGNHILEAITSGIYEVIERDGICCTIHEKKVRIETIQSEVVQDLITQVKRAGVGLSLFDCMVDTGVYIFHAKMFDRKIGLTSGYGAHLDPEIAMVRAITEAIQARAVFVSASRDDIFESVFHRLRKFNTQGIIDALGRVEETTDVSRYTSMATETFEGDIHLLLQKLQNAGLKHVLVFDLSVEGSCVSVVKVVIPGLEGYKTETYQPGKRALLHRGKEEGFHMPAGAL